MENAIHWPQYKFPTAAHKLYSKYSTVPNISELCATMTNSPCKNMKSQ